MKDYYKHSSGLIFHTKRLVDLAETKTEDICVVVAFLPNCVETPMLIIDYYCGEYDPEQTKRIADNFCNDKSDDEIANLIEVQDLCMPE